MRTSAVMRRCLLSCVAVVVLTLGLGLPSVSIAPAAPAAAAEASQFNPGLLVSDENFYDGAAMSQAAVQAFLDTQNRCGQRSNCVAALRGDTPTMEPVKLCV